MKKGIYTKLGAAACVLTLVTVSLLGGTFAKYTTAATGTGTAAAAKWAIAMKSNDTAITGDAFTFDLANTNTNAAAAAGKIAPGSKGEIKLTIDGTGSEVGYSYQVKIDTAALGGVPVKFYSDQGMTTPLTYTGNVAELAKAEVALADVGTAKTTSIYWQWDPDSTDSSDTTLGKAATSGTISVTMTAEQLITTTP